MLESIRISSAATFPDTEQVLGNLSKFNFFFGSNGSGKTTISRIIADAEYHPACGVSWKAGSALQPMVYNRDFVERNFNQTEELKGVFTLGEGVGIKEKIDAAKVIHDDLVKKIGSLNLQLQGQDSANGKLAELKKLEDALKDICWKQKGKHDAKLQGAFKGVRSKAENFKDKVLQELQSNSAELFPQEELERKAESIFGEDPTTEQIVSSVDINALQQHESNVILQKRVIGKDDVDIAAMIKKLGNSDWVREGRSFYEINDSICPFCQQKTDAAFSKSLNEYFDEAFETDSKAINDLLESYKTDADRIKLQLASIVSAPSKFLDVEKLKAEKELLESRITINLQRLAEKKKEPSQIFNLESIDNVGDAIKSLIDDANAKVTAHNQLVANISNERNTLTLQVWRFVLEELKSELVNYQQKHNELKRAIDSINAAINKATEDRKAKDKEIRELEKTATSIQPTLNGINELLASFGFNSFSLALADDKISYKLVRLDGADAKETLSEGERTFVTFLYFYHLLKGSNTTEGITTDRIVVFDDPVSSLDSDVLFIVSSLIKRVCDDVKNNVGQIKQVFVLTHNVYFHKEVTYSSRRSGTAAFSDETFWTVRKSGTVSQVEKHPQNPISTSYELLWADVQRANHESSSIANTLRRILEHYFKILGKTDFDELCDLFQGNDKFVCKSLLSWVNAGSHGFFDDLHVSNSNVSVETYLRVFREIFEKSDHIAHYKMMMGEENITVLPDPSEAIA